ncbi:MAG: nucleotidyltransferase [Gammaproteobacteria bacterium]|nr:nucleotidyltransferase [Gammaproteobacteria bacterium]
MANLDRSRLPFSDPLDAILAEVAVRIQLPPSKYWLAVERYRKISEWLEREGSPLKDRIARLYPQGSMAIRATIASGVSDGNYDIDIIAELMLAVGVKPQEVLDLLFKAIRGEAGSRYHAMVKRRSRCVAVFYADGMHLDVTPVVLEPRLAPRTSFLFHDDPDEPTETGMTLLMNAWGFCQWFKGRTEDGKPFSDSFAELARSHDAYAEAEKEPVDPQEDPARKSSDVVALQFMKRNRNLRFEGREGRMPSSVLLSKWVGDDAIDHDSLMGALEHHVERIRRRIAIAESRGMLVSEFNPACDQDCFTDRWPLSRAEQQLYLSDLIGFRKALLELRSGELSIDRIQKLLIELFGETHVRSAVEAVQGSVGSETQAGNTGHKPGGGIVIGGAAAPGTGRSAKPNTNYGGPIELS